LRLSSRQVSAAPDNQTVSPPAFLAGCGAAQAAPGPLFTFSTDLDPTAGRAQVARRGVNVVAVGPPPH
jgi:hypothetical protein